MNKEQNGATEAGCLNGGPDKGLHSSALAQVRRVNTLKMEQYIMAPTSAAGNMQTEPNREREKERRGDFGAD